MAFDVLHHSVHLEERNDCVCLTIDKLLGHPKSAGSERVMTTLTHRTTFSQNLEDFHVVLYGLEHEVRNLLFSEVMLERLVEGNTPVM